MKMIRSGMLLLVLYLTAYKVKVHCFYNTIYNFFIILRAFKILHYAVLSNTGQMFKI